MKTLQRDSNEGTNPSVWPTTSSTVRSPEPSGLLGGYDLMTYNPSTIDMLWNGALLGGDLAKVQDLLASSLSMILNSPVESIHKFLDIINSPLYPMKNLMSTDIRDVVDQTLGLRLISNMSDDQYKLFSTVINEIRDPLKSNFMERPSTEPLGILEKVKIELLDHELLNGPLKSLRGPSRLYFNDIIPKINSMAILNTVLNDTSSQLAQILKVPSVSVQFVSGLLYYKLENNPLLLDGGLRPITDIASEVVELARNLVADVATVVRAVPVLGANYALEMLVIASDVAVGAVEAKLGALQWIAHLPVEIIEGLLEIPESSLDGQQWMDPHDVMKSHQMALFRQAMRLLDVYQGFHSAFGYPVGHISPDEFSMMSNSMMGHVDDMHIGDYFRANNPFSPMMNRMDQMNTGSGNPSGYIPYTYGYPSP